LIEILNLIEFLKEFIYILFHLFDILGNRLVGINIGLEGIKD
jgi:hypothetical protein